MAERLQRTSRSLGTPGTPGEGVIKFELRHQRSALAPAAESIALEQLGWRRILRAVGLIGREAQRYEGAAFGNLSCRLDAGFQPPGRRSFVITGTQTSDLPQVDASNFALVDEYDYRNNRVASRGLTAPSSEAMTHGAIYDLDASIHTVFHAHSPEIWHLARQLDLPTTDPAVEYGTPAMAAEVGRQFRLGDLRRSSLLVMGGHLDGIMVFGKTPEEAGSVLLSWLARSYAR